MSDRKTMLIVDDDPDNLDLLRRIFQDLYDIKHADSGEAGVEILLDTHIDIIITDQRMPNMSGNELLERSIEINPKAIKIILSAYTDTSEILSAINVCRITHYLIKPTTAETVRKVVRDALDLVEESKRYD